MTHDEQPSTLMTMARQVYARAARRQSVDGGDALPQLCRNSIDDTENNKQQQAQHQQHQQRGSGAIFVASALAIIAALSASAVGAAPAPVRSDPCNRFLLKRSHNENQIAEATVDSYDDAVFAGSAAGTRPMLPDKWSDIFLTHQERSFFPSGYGSGASIGPLNAFVGGGGGGSSSSSSSSSGYSMEKRRRGLDETPQFVDNYVNLVEPGRLEWNFNRL